jgi:hypothetical protein
MNVKYLGNKVNDKIIKISISFIHVYKLIIIVEIEKEADICYNS